MKSDSGPNSLIAVPQRDLDFAADMILELERARRKYPSTITTPHEGYAIILEELDEFWEECRRKEHDPAKMRAELLQVAAMATRTATDVIVTRLAQGQPEKQPLQKDWDVPNLLADFPAAPRPRRKARRS